MPASEWNSDSPRALQPDIESEAQTTTFFNAVFAQIRAYQDPNLKFSMPNVRPVGRSYFTIEPKRAATVFLAAFGDAIIVPQNLSATRLPQCANVTTIRRRTGETFTFVQDGRKPNPVPHYPTHKLLMSAKQSLQRVGNKEALWSQYEDNHDGYGLADTSDLPSVVQRLNGSAQWYWADEAKLKEEKSLHGVFRFWVPGSLWTSEFGLSGFATRFGDREEETVKTLIETHTSNPDVCRKPGLDSVYSSENMMRFADSWFKATFASATPELAQAFAVEYLGAKPILSPYEYPVEGCHFAKWAFFANRTQAKWENPASDGTAFMMHFVLSANGPFDTPAPTTSKFGYAIDAGRKIQDNIFDRYMYDSVTLWVDDLAPFVAKFDTDKVPYLIRGWRETGVAGVFVSIPGSEAVIELRSNVGVPAERIEPYDVCSAS